MACRVAACGERLFSTRTFEPWINPLNAKTAIKTNWPWRRQTCGVALNVCVVAVSSG